MKFNPGDEILVVDGSLKGQYGSIVEFEPTFERYFVLLPDLHATRYYAVREDELDFLPAEDSEQEDEQPVEDDEDDGVLDVSVYGFGIPHEVFQRHLEYLIGRSLVHVGKVGPEEAFFGFQEFEGKTATEVLLELMFKLEEGMAMFAQAHILIGRVVSALESVHEQDPN